MPTVALLVVVQLVLLVESPAAAVGAAAAAVGAGAAARGMRSTDAASAADDCASRPPPPTLFAAPVPPVLLFSGKMMRAHGNNGRRFDVGEKGEKMIPSSSPSPIYSSPSSSPPNCVCSGFCVNISEAADDACVKVESGGGGGGCSSCGIVWLLRFKIMLLLVVHELVPSPFLLPASFERQALFCVVVIDAGNNGLFVEHAATPSVPL